MSTMILGFLLIIGILVAAFEGNASTYLQVRSVSIVIGGTFAILLFANPLSVLKSLGLCLKMLLKREDHLSHHQDTLNALIRDRSARVPEDAHPLIAYASNLWQQGIDPDLFVVLLSQKRSDLTSRGVDAVQSLKSLAKYPPALGMTGTVMGIVSVFYSLDQNKDKIGVNLSVAMTATFFGLILSNMVISPLADRLFVRQVRLERICENMYEVILLINRQEPATLIQGEMNDRVA